MEARFQAVTGLSCLSHGLPKPHKTASHSVLKAYTFEDHFRRPFSEYGLRFWGFPYTFCWQCFTRADSSPIQWSITCAMVNMIHQKKICRGLKIKDSFWVKNVRCLQSVRIFSIISPHWRTRKESANCVSHARVWTQQFDYSRAVIALHERLALAFFHSELIF